MCWHSYESYLEKRYMDARMDPSVLHDGAVTKTEKEQRKRNPGGSLRF